MADKQLSALQVKKLPWPQALLARGSLTAHEAHAVGKLIVERVWQGQFDRAHRRKQWSVRRLQGVLGVASPARYTRCVQVYQMAGELKLDSKLEGVSVSTLFLVAGLPKTLRKKIALQALKEGWSKGRLEQEIAKANGPRLLGRPQGPTFLRALLQCSNEPLLGDLDKLPTLDAPTLAMASKQADRLLKDLERLRKTLNKHG